MYSVHALCAQSVVHRCGEKILVYVIWCSVGGVMNFKSDFIKMFSHFSLNPMIDFTPFCYFTFVGIMSVC